MTALDDAASKALAFLKASENVVQSFRALSVEHRSALARDFPTLNTGLALLSATHKPLDGA